MEIAASAFMALTSAASAAVPGVAGALSAAGSVGAASGLAGAASGIAGAGSGFLSALQGGMTIASSISSILGGVSKFNEGQIRGRFADIEAEASRLKGEEQAIRIKREMVQRVGDTRVAYAGSGLDISSGGAIEGSLRDQAAFETGLALSSADIRRSGGLAKAAMARSEGTADLISGIVKGGKEIAGYKLDLAKRG